MTTPKRTSDAASELREAMLTTSKALIEAAYSGIVQGKPLSDPIDMAVFNGVVNFMKFDAGVEPASSQKSGISALAEGMQSGSRSKR